MKTKLLSFVLLSTLLIACGDDSSSSQEEFYCNVNRQKNVVRQDFFVPGVMDGYVEISVKNGEAHIIQQINVQGISKTEVDEKCDSLKYLYGNSATLDCDDGNVYMSLTTSSEEVGAPSEVIADLESICDLYEEAWLNELSSNSNTQPSSSSKNQSNSISIKKSSSSSVNNPYSEESEISSSEEPESSSSEEPVSSSSEFVRVYHDDAFDGMSVAPDAFADDDSTLYFEDFGGNVLCLYRDSAYNTGFFMEENLPSGKLEFFFRPHEDFFDAARVLIGNDGARLLVYYDGMNLVLMMNKSNVFRYVQKPAEILNDWNYVQVIWGDDRAALYLNNEMVGEMELEGGYESSDRSWEHELVIGQKSECCMSGAGMNSRMRTSADFGPIKVSVPRVESFEDSQADEDSSSENPGDDSSSENPGEEPLSGDSLSGEGALEPLNE